MSAFSKTDEFCDCNTLQNAADDPNLPIEFDAELNEFHLVYNVNRGEGLLNLWHCFLCGGKAPKSKRHLLFATISNAESFRLRELTNPLKTLDAVLHLLGKPDQDLENGIITMLPETKDSPPQEQAYRTLLYEKFSDVADIRVTVYPDDKVGISFTGKYVGNKNKT